MPIRIAVIGAGNMGGALIGGIVGRVTPADCVVATTRTPEHAASLAAKYGIAASAGSNREAAEHSDLIVLAVKPGTLPKVLLEIREVLTERTILLSLAGSFSITMIERVIGKTIPIFRAMPNIPVVVEEGATAVAANGVCSPEQRKLVEDIFRSVGCVAFVEENLMHAVTALSGSGPAYVYMMIEAMIAGGLKMGLSREVATKLAEQTVLGAAKHVRESGLHPAVLRDQVITPGGVTISAIHELERLGMRSMMISAIETATKHSEARMRALESKLDK